MSWETERAYTMQSYFRPKILQNLRFLLRTFQHHSFFEDSPVRQFWLLYSFPLRYFKYYVSFHKESSPLQYSLP